MNSGLAGTKLTVREIACVASVSVRRAFPPSGHVQIGARTKTRRGRRWWGERRNAFLQTPRF